MIVGELKNTSRCFLSFVKERDALSQSDLQSFMYKDRLNGEDVLFERGRQRDRVSLHNFTARNVSKEEQQILNYGGGFPPANFWQVPYPEIWHISYIFLGIESEMENMHAD